MSETKERTFTGWFQTRFLYWFWPANAARHAQIPCSFDQQTGVVQIDGDLHLEISGRLTINTGKDLLLGSSRQPKENGNTYAVHLNPRMDEDNEPIVFKPKPAYVPYAKRQSSLRLMEKRKRGSCKC